MNHPPGAPVGRNGATIGVLVMAYGGPTSLDEVEPYLREVRGFRPTPEDLIRDVRARYAAIGGRSRILDWTETQARALEGALNGARGTRYRAVVGMRHWRPRIADAVAQLAAAGITRAVGVVMAPHYSRMSTGAYFDAVARADSGLAVAPIERWHLLPGYITAVVERIDHALMRFPASERDRVPVLFTAHSLPRRILEWSDPYPTLLAETVRAVSAEIGTRPCPLAYQSAAHTAEPWLEPTAGAALRAFAAAEHRSVLVAPIGFTAEHVEVLYDIDIELRREAEALGMRLERIAMLGDAPAMIDGLAGLVRDAATRQGWT